LENSHFHTNSFFHKWVQKWASPYKMPKKVHKDVYLIDILKKGKLYHVFHVSVLKKFTPNEKGFHLEQ